MADLERIRPSPADPEASVFGLGPDRIAGRWESPAMPAHYARAELAAQGAVARYYNKNTRTPGNT